MSKVIAIDYGLKRCGLAITDEMRMIASPLETVETKEIIDRLRVLIKKENVGVIVLGEAKKLSGVASEITVLQEKFAHELRKHFPEVPVERVNEMFTSKMAAQALVMGGMKKSDRRNKSNLDKVSAALILQTYLMMH